MQLVAGIRFRPAGRVYYYDASHFPDLKTGQYVIVETTRGKEAGRVVIAPRQVEVNETGEPHKAIERLADEDDLRRLLHQKSKERDALQRCQHKITQHQLPMKLVEAEYAFDGTRLTFYFASEDRVDFRSLVRDLASTFHTRIELRQIGTRDHAKHLGGLGPCGKTLCCSSWLTDFGAVSIKMAKEQSLPLNPNKISGVCGRLMCCLAYENDQYIETKASMPTLGTMVMTPNGQGKVIGHNLPRTSIEVLLESGATITLPVSDASLRSTLPADAFGCGASCSVPAAAPVNHRRS